ncbi:BrnT family toxin [Xanthobacter sp. KR7-225]|uniref:BrnT family toxin n=1 Tax=Xanthobacter sp. KR7-225 TaxID=3156613 RepID=UPI0032B5CD67
MLDFDRIVGFQWDDGNARKSVDKHAVSQSEAEEVFANEPLLLLADARHSGAELRLHAFGRTDAGRLLHIAFTLRDDGTPIRVISARAMSRKERERYGQEA